MKQEYREELKSDLLSAISFGTNAELAAWAENYGLVLLAEIEQLSAQINLSCLINELLPKLAEIGGDESWLTYDYLDQLWKVGRTGEPEYISCELEVALLMAKTDLGRS